MAAGLSADGLLASVAINIGLAFVMLSLFSVLKKQPVTAPVYYARRIAAGEPLPLHRRFCLGRFCPSFSWIFHCLYITEEQILDDRGLDALVLIRLFKLGIRFFAICSIVGLVILVPVNYTSRDSSSHKVVYSMDYFTIANISEGSDRLWAHFACLCFVTFYISYLLYKEYKEILYIRIQHMCDQRNRPDQFTVLVRGIPICKDHNARGCSVDHFFSKYHPYSFLSYEIVQDGEKELPAAFVSFKSRVGAIVAAQTQQHVHPLLWITESAPEPREVLWNNLDIPYRRVAVHKLAVFLAAAVLIIFFAVPVTAIQGIVQFEKIQQWFPPARALELIPGLSSVLTGYFPSLILNGFIYLIPYAMFAMAWLEGCVSRSQLEIKACGMVFYFLVGNVFFLSLLSGSLFDQIGESFIHPGELPNRLARAVSAQADFFISYVLTNGLSGFSLEILQFGMIMWHLIRTYLFRQVSREDTYLYGFQYYRIIPIVLLAVLIGMVYAVVAPLLLPFLIIYFLLGYAVYVNQMYDVYDTLYETYGLYWPEIHHFIFVTVVIMQFTMIGLFLLKSKPAAAIATLVLLLLSILFNQYCKMRFYPSFLRCSIQIAKENDERDEMEGTLEANRESALSAYHPPWREHKDENSGEDSLKEQLVSAFSRLVPHHEP